jgi:hypothetical protein
MNIRSSRRNVAGRTGTGGTTGTAGGPYNADSVAVNQPHLRIVRHAHNVQFRLTAPVRPRPAAAVVPGRSPGRGRPPGRFPCPQARRVSAAGRPAREKRACAQEMPASLSHHRLDISVQHARAVDELQRPPAVPRRPGAQPAAGRVGDHVRTERHHGRRRSAASTLRPDRFPGRHELAVIRAGDPDVAAVRELQKLARPIAGHEVTSPSSTAGTRVPSPSALASALPHPHPHPPEGATRLRPLSSSYAVSCPDTPSRCCGYPATRATASYWSAPRRATASARVRDGLRRMTSAHAQRPWNS